MEIKYDRIGSGYNTTRKPDPYLTDRILFHLNPNINSLYLDIGCGTGNYTDQFQKRGFSFIGIDPSEKMLTQARERNTIIEWKKGTAESTGLEDAYVDGITASLTIHHWSDLRTAFSEMKRVLKPSGKLVVFTSTPKQMKGYWLNHYFPKMMEDSIKQMPSFDVVVEAMNYAGLEALQKEKYNIQPNLKDQFLYCGKEDPELYFDKDIRKGISSFSDLSNAKEVENGLQKLQEDIKSGEVIKIMNSYKNDLGDYLYIIAQKN